MRENKVTNIEWTDKTWNPILGCSKVSEGCCNCYAINQAHRNNAIGQSMAEKGKNTGRLAYYDGLTEKRGDRIEWTGKVALVPEALEIPLQTKKPTRWFVNSMSDLFHESVPDEWIDQVFALMAATPHHSYQILTKRPERMNKYCSSCTREQLRRAAINIFSSLPIRYIPASNIHLGVTIENQKAANERIPLLLQTPAAKRFLSIEPMLEEIDFNQTGYPHPLLSLKCENCKANVISFSCPVCKRITQKAECIDQIIIGGESGHNARPFHLEWVITLIEQCDQAGVKVFFKQCGSNPYWKGEPLKLNSKKGNDLSELPEELQSILNRREII